MSKTSDDSLLALGGAFTDHMYYGRNLYDTRGTSCMHCLYALVFSERYNSGANNQYHNHYH